MDGWIGNTATAHVTSNHEGINIAIPLMLKTATQYKNLNRIA
jgi:hypothetical protein